MIIYLASPYSHPSDKTRELNFHQITALAAKMVSEGHVVISPIAYGHTLLSYREMPSSWEFWQNFCSQILYKCDKIIVCKMEGWENSKGVADEISIAKDRGIPIEYVEPFLGKCKKCLKDFPLKNIDETHLELYKCQECGYPQDIKEVI